MTILMWLKNKLKIKKRNNNPFKTTEYDIIESYSEGISGLKFL